MNCETKTEYVVLQICISSFFFKFYFIFKLYIIVLVLPNIKMNPPQICISSCVSCAMDLILDLQHLIEMFT